MDFQVVLNPFPHLIISNYFTPEEMEKVWKETEFLFPKLLPPEGTHAALVDGQSEERKKRGIGVFVDEVYQPNSRHFSDILEVTRKMYHNTAFHEMVEPLGIYFKLFKNVNWDSTLLQYYGDGDYYKGHQDQSLFTASITYFKEPKQFTGGDMMFPNDRYVIPCENNQFIMFPSIMEHEVMEVSATPSPMGGRFSIAHLINWKT